MEQLSQSPDTFPVFEDKERAEKMAIEPDKGGLSIYQGPVENGIQSFVFYIGHALLRNTYKQLYTYAEGARNMSNDDNWKIFLAALQKKYQIVIHNFSEGPNYAEIEMRRHDTSFSPEKIAEDIQKIAQSTESLEKNKTDTVKTSRTRVMEILNA